MRISDPLQSISLALFADSVLTSLADYEHGASVDTPVSWDELSTLFSMLSAPRPLPQIPPRVLRLIASPGSDVLYRAGTSEAEGPAHGAALITLFTRLGEQAAVLAGSPPADDVLRQQRTKELRDFFEAVSERATRNLVPGF